MSKPLSTHTSVNLTPVGPSALVKNTTRMGLYWLCGTVLLWPSLHPLVEWRSLTVVCFFAASSVVVPTLGYLSASLRGDGGSVVFPPSQGSSPSFAHTLSHTGVIAVEIFIVLLATMIVERLLF